MALNSLPKLARLRLRLRRLGGALVAFSGGVDSTLLAVVARQELGARALAVTVRSPLLPRREQQRASRLARRLGLPHAWLDFRPLENARVAANPPDRCYHCKLAMFRALTGLARRRGLPAVLEGGHLDDRRDYRPGRRALRACGVCSPLRAAGFTKADIRRVSRTLGLPDADRPAESCLATRLPYGVRLTRRALRASERLEAALARAGCQPARARQHGNVVRLEVPAADLPRLLASRRRLVALAKRQGFVYIAADLEGYRRGSQNAAMPAAGIKSP